MIENANNRIARIRKMISGDYSGEKCGLLITHSGGDLVIQVENRHVNPDASFVCPPALTAEFYLRTSAYWHVHGENCPPSQHDMISCKATARPWIVLTPDDQYVLDPTRMELEGRKFDDTNNCLTAAADWLFDQGIPFPYFTDATGIMRGESFRDLIENAHRFGWFAIPFYKEALKRNDVIVFKIGRDNHVGVYTDGGQMFHQPESTLSRVELIPPKWIGNAKFIMRNANAHIG